MNVYDKPEAARNLAKDLLKETKARDMEGLLQLDTEMLKAAAQGLWQDMCAPTTDGTLIPADVYRAYQEGAASDIEFIIGMPSLESWEIRSFVGEENYGKMVETGLADLLSSIDDSHAASVEQVIKDRSAISSDLEAKSEILVQWIVYSVCRSAQKLSEAGGKVHLLYWDKKTLIESLGSHTVNVMASLLGNSEAMQAYGKVMDKDFSGMLQEFLHKFVKGDALKLYWNEIKGVSAIDWKPFPKALIVSDKHFSCDTIEDSLKEIEGLFGLNVSS